MPYKDPEKRRKWRAANREKVRKTSQRYYQAHREENRLRSKRWYEKNTERQKALVKAWAKAHPEKVKAASRFSHLRRKYGITQEEFERAETAQQGKCVICRRAARLVVDHNHVLDLRRDLLCAQCNQGLGLFREDTAALMAAAQYLRVWAVKHSYPAGREVCEALRRPRAKH